MLRSWSSRYKNSMWYCWNQQIFKCFLKTMQEIIQSVWSTYYPHHVKPIENRTKCKRMFINVSRNLLQHRCKISEISLCYCYFYEMYSKEKEELVPEKRIFLRNIHLSRTTQQLVIDWCFTKNIHSLVVLFMWGTYFL